MKLTVVDLLMLFAVGWASGLATWTTAEHFKKNTSFSVGECVRELGHSMIEKIITVNSEGAIETEYPDKFRPGENRMSAYTTTIRLMKVSCQ